MGLIAAIAVFALLIMWAPWSGPNVANAPGTTVGSSTRPVTPAAPVDSSADDPGCTYNHPIINDNPARERGYSLAVFFTYFRWTFCFFRSSIKCCAPSCVSNSPDLSGTFAFWQRLFTVRCASVIIGSSITLSYLTSAFSRISSINFDASAFVRLSS